MRQNNKVEGTKIAQAAKDLNVTSVTIRRYISEFNIATTADENGIKVLPPQAMDELQEIRRLKEDGNSNAKVLEQLEEKRVQGGEPEKVERSKPKARARAQEKVSDEVVEEEENEEVAAAARPKVQEKRRAYKKSAGPEEAEPESELESSAEESKPAEEEEKIAEVAEGEGAVDARSKHTLTCQTCGKTFEHMNPRLRDCLDCYRAKRKERRRGGGDRHKNVIQHPLAQQAISKAPQTAGQAASLNQVSISRVPAASAAVDFAPQVVPSMNTSAAVAQAVLHGPVRNYRKAIEETRQITGSLKRRLERPDLPEGERRWLEQIYAYQLILHQGWRHLAEYKATAQEGE